MQNKNILKDKTSEISNNCQSPKKVDNRNSPMKKGSQSPNNNSPPRNYSSNTSPQRHNQNSPNNHNNGYKSPFSPSNISPKSRKAMNNISNIGHQYNNYYNHHNSMNHGGYSPPFFKSHGWMDFPPSHMPMHMPIITSNSMMYPSSRPNPPFYSHSHNYNRSHLHHSKKWNNGGVGFPVDDRHSWGGHRALARV